MLADRRVAGQRAAQRLPARPAAIRRHLPDMPERLIGAAGEELQPAILVASRSKLDIGIELHDHVLFLSFYDDRS